MGIEPATFRLVAQCLNHLRHGLSIHIVKLRIVMKSDMQHIPCDRNMLEYICAQLILDACSFFCDMFRLIIVAIPIQISLRHISSAIGLCLSFLHKQLQHTLDTR